MTYNTLSIILGAKNPCVGYKLPEHQNQNTLDILRIKNLRSKATNRADLRNLQSAANS